MDVCGDTPVSRELGRLAADLLLGVQRSTTRPDVSEVYSPERVVRAARELGLIGGISMDLTTGWNFSKAEHRRMAEQHVRKEQPLLLIGSPMCTDWSATMNLNCHKCTKSQKEKRMKLAREHVVFCIKLHKLQHESGRYFLHEHPLSAQSWSDTSCTTAGDYKNTCTHV